MGVKNVASDERYFIAGPGGRPMLPASILTEAMAQAGAVLILTKPENRARLIYFMGIDRVRYRRPVVAGDTGPARGDRASACARRWAPCAGVARVDGQRRVRGPDDLRAAADRPRLSGPGRRAQPRRPRPVGPLSLARALSKFGVCSRAEAGALDRGGPRARRRAGGPTPAAPHRSAPAPGRASTAGAWATTPSAWCWRCTSRPATSPPASIRAAGRPSTTCWATSARWVFPVGRLDRDSSGLLIAHQRPPARPAAHRPRAPRAQDLPRAGRRRARRGGARRAARGRRSSATARAVAAGAGARAGHAGATARGWRSSSPRARTARCAACARRWATRCGAGAGEDRGPGAGRLAPRPAARWGGRRLGLAGGAPAAPRPERSTR